MYNGYASNTFHIDLIFIIQKSLEKLILVPNKYY